MKKILITIMLMSIAFAVDRGLPIQELFAGLRDKTNDIVLSGGTVEFFIAGTTTPKDVYTNLSKVTVASNPYTLDAYGRAQLWAKDDGYYKLVIKDSSSVTVDTWDNQFYGTALNDIDNRNIGDATPLDGAFTDLTIEGDTIVMGYFYC